MPVDFHRIIHVFILSCLQSIFFVELSKISKFGFGLLRFVLIFIFSGVCSTYLNSSAGPSMLPVCPRPGQCTGNIPVVNTTIVPHADCQAILPAGTMSSTGNIEGPLYLIHIDLPLSPYCRHNDDFYAVIQTKRYLHRGNIKPAFCKRPLLHVCRNFDFPGIVSFLLFLRVTCGWYTSNHSPHSAGC